MTEVKPLSDEERLFTGVHGPHPQAVNDIRRAFTALKSENEKLRVALSDLVSDPLRYNGNRIEIDCASHAAAMGRVMRARVALAKG